MLDKLTVQNGGDVNRCASSYNILGLEVKHLRSKKNQNDKTNKTKTNGTIEISLISYEYFVVGFSDYRADLNELEINIVYNIIA